MAKLVVSQYLRGRGGVGIRTTIPYPMSFDLERMLASKRALRRELAARPIVEKLRMLDAMRERAVAIQSGRSAPAIGGLGEEPPPFRVQRRKSDEDETR